MKKYLAIFAASGLLFGCGGDGASTETNKEENEQEKVDSTALFESNSELLDLGTPGLELASEDDTLSYCYGYNSASQLIGRVINSNFTAVNAGFNDDQNGEAKFDDTQAQNILMTYSSNPESRKDSSETSGSDQLISNKDSVCYAYGIMLSYGIKNGYTWIKPSSFIGGFNDRANNSNPAEDKVMAALQAISMKKQEEKMKEAQAEGEKFLEENKKKEGVQVTESGLQYEVLVEGTGPKPKETDKVKVHYHGTLVDGTVFDSSVERNQPAEFPVNRVIQGWIEGLQLMPVGSKWKLYIPYDLAYGERGTGGIPPFSTLIFEVELLEIVK